MTDRGQEQAGGDEGGWLGQVPLGRRERHYEDRLLFCFPDRPSDVAAMLRRAAGAEGSAVICGTERLSYQELAQRAEQLASGLATAGIGKGDRIALLLPTSLEFAMAFFAAAMIGAISVPLNGRESSAELGHKLADSGARCVIYHCDYASLLPASDDLGDIQLLVHVGDGAAAAVSRPLETIFKSADFRPDPPAEEDIATIIYTSGTSGKPKGVKLSHLALVHAAMNYEMTLGLGPSDVGLAPAPLSHVTGLTGGLLAATRSMASLVLIRDFKAADFLEVAERERMTFTIMVPAMVKLCLMQPQFRNKDLSCWRVAGYGGGPMVPALIEELTQALPRLRLVNCYGATETGSAIAMMPPDQTPHRPAAVGKGVPCGEILVMDERGREMPSGEAGEIWLRGPMMAHGYWNNDKATSDEFVAGFWRSGDIGMLDAEGYLTLLDRAKDVINRGGYKIFAIEVEALLSALPGVTEAAVVGKPCPVLGERVHAVLVTTGEDFDLEAARMACRMELTDYKVPESFTISTTALPRNANGKILKKEIRAALWPAE